MKVGKFASTVFMIIADNPKNTAGEIFSVYKEFYPETTRSRNEIAKRVTDLYNMGLLCKGTSRPCNITGKQAAIWTAKSNTNGFDFSEEPAEENGPAPVTEEIGTDDEQDDDDCDGCDCDGCGSREETARRVEEQFGERCAAMDPEDEQFLRQFRGTVDQLARHPLFKALAPESTVSDIARLKKALRYF